MYEPKIHFISLRVKYLFWRVWILFCTHLINIVFLNVFKRQSQIQNIKKFNAPFFPKFRHKYSRKINVKSIWDCSIRSLEKTHKFDSFVAFSLNNWVVLDHNRVAKNSPPFVHHSTIFVFKLNKTCFLLTLVKRFCLRKNVKLPQKV